MLRYIKTKTNLRIARITCSLLGLLSIVSPSPALSDDSNQPTESSPVSGTVLNLKSMRTKSVNADPFVGTFYWYRIPLTGPELKTVIQTMLPLKSPEKSKQDLALELKIQQKLFRQDLVDSNDVRELYELRMKEKNFVGAETSLHLLEKIASLKENNSIEQAKIQKELEDLKIPRTLARIVRADACVERGDYLTAYMELQIARAFFDGLPGNETTKRLIDSKMAKIEKLKPEETKRMRDSFSPQ